MLAVSINCVANREITYSDRHANTSTSTPTPHHTTPHHTTPGPLPTLHDTIQHYTTTPSSAQHTCHEACCILFDTQQSHTARLSIRLYNRTFVVLSSMFHAGIQPHTLVQCSMGHCTVDQMHLSCTCSCQANWDSCHMSTSSPPI